MSPWPMTGATVRCATWAQSLAAWMPSPKPYAGKTAWPPAHQRWLADVRDIARDVAPPPPQRH